MMHLSQIKDKIHFQDDNSRIVLINTFCSFGVKGLSMLLALFTTPAYIRFFENNEVLGAWFTILSVLAWILNCDMGIGNGLRNNVVYAIAEKDSDKIKKYISSAYISLSVIAVIVLVLVTIIGKISSWNRIFNLSENVLPSSTLSQAVTILLIAIVLQFVLRTITSILYALQKAFIPGLLNLATNVVMLVYVLIANHIGNNNNIVTLALVYLFAVNLPLVIATVYVFATLLKQAIPQLVFFRMDYAKSILKVGGAFLWLQIMAMVLDNTNSYLITAFIGNAAVVEYQLYYKVFSLPGVMVTLLSASLWSTVTKAKAEKNEYWLYNSYKRFMAIGGMVTVCEFCIIIVLQPFFNIWLGQNTIPVNYAIAVVFALSGSLMVIRMILATFSNGLCEIKVQAVCLTLGATMNIPLAYLFAQITHNYIAIVIANIISMIPYCIAQPVSFRNRWREIANGRKQAK